MRNKCFLVIIACVLLAGCMNTKPSIIFDESVAPENTAWITTVLMGTITGFNGVEVNWGKYTSLKLIQIPAGDTLLEWDLDAYVILGTITYNYKGKDILLRYNFLPDKKYTFQVVKEDQKEDGRYGVNIYRWEKNEKIPSLDAGVYGWRKNFLEFVPFLNVDPGGRTILQ